MNCDGPCPDNVCAIVVSYNPDRELELRIRSLRGQVIRILVVDNGSGLDATEMIARIHEQGEGKVEVIFN